MTTPIRVQRHAGRSRVRTPAFAASIGMLLMLAAAGCNGGGDTADAGTAAPAIPVEIATPVRGDVLSTYTGTAPIEAYADATVIAKVAGEVVELLAEEGDEVSRGTVLARLDGDRLRLTVAETGARLQKLRQDFQRNIELRKRDLISAGDFEKIQYEMEALEAGYELAMLELGYTEIRAPIDGVVSARLIRNGNTIAAETPAFQVTSLEPLVAYLHAPEREYRRMQAGLAAEISVDALPGAAFTGTVARTSPVVDPQTGTFKLTVEVSDPTRRLKPGMFGRIRIVSDRRENALRIPRNAIVETADTAYVFVVNGDVAEKRVIETGFTDGAYVEVRQGLDDGERFVVVGQSGLRDGASVTVVESTSMLHATAGNDH